MIKRKKEKADVEALNSHFMRIPRMDASTARDLLDLGFSRIYELAGRSPEALYESLKEKNPDIPPLKLHLLRMAVYYAEASDPDPRKLRPEVWMD
jgi:hypothetical protein